MASTEGFHLSPRTLQMHTDSMHADSATSSSSSSSSSVGTAERGRQGSATPQGAISSASSPGSWVIDPDDGGWHGVGSSSPPSSRTRQPQHQPDHQHDESGRSRQISPSASSSSLHSWARVPLSPQSSLGAGVGMMAAGAKAAEYPAIGSPPRSPGGARAGVDCGGTAEEGLVSLAREEMSNDFDVKIYANPPVDADPVPADQRDRIDEDNETTTMAEDAGRAETGPTQTTGEIEDVDGDDLSTVDVSASDGAGVATDAVHALSTGGVAPGPVPAGVENAVHAAPPPLLEAEVKVDSAATIEASWASVGVESESVPPTSTPSSGAQEETSHLSHNTIRYASLENAGAETPAREGPRGAVAPPSSLASAEDAETAVAAAAAEVEAVGAVDGDGDDGDVDGKQLDRLWRWTGLLTAARMGVIPMIVCIAVAALSCQSGGAGKGQGSGAGSGGGNGATHSGELGGGGGGGGAGCFHACGERHPYGFPPMPFCAAPCCLTAF